MRSPKTPKPPREPTAADLARGEALVSAHQKALKVAVTDKQMAEEFGEGCRVEETRPDGSKGWRYDLKGEQVLRFEEMDRKQREFDSGAGQLADSYVPKQKVQLANGEAVEVREHHAEMVDRKRGRRRSYFTFSGLPPKKGKS